jgi:hypothetical protein
MACCDAQHIGRVPSLAAAVAHVGGHASRLSQTSAQLGGHSHPVQQTSAQLDDHAHPMQPTNAHGGPDPKRDPESSPSVVSTAACKTKRAARRATPR